MKGFLQVLLGIVLALIVGAVLLWIAGTLLGPRM